MNHAEAPGYDDRIKAMAAREASEGKNDPERIAAAIEATATSLAMLCAAGARGDDAGANTLLEGSVQHAFQAMGQFARLMRMMR